MSNDTPKASDSEINAIFDQLNAADFTLAKIQEDLKDADKRQEVGLRLVEMLADATASGLVFQKVKLGTKAGTLKLGFEFPILVFRDLLGNASKLPSA